MENTLEETLRDDMYESSIACRNAYSEFDKNKTDANAYNKYIKSLKEHIRALEEYTNIVKNNTENIISFYGKSIKENNHM